MAEDIFATRVRELLNYSEATGQFTWRANRRRVDAGDVAGTLHINGYVYVTVDYRRYRAHRLAWLYVYGSWPTKDLDHINRDKKDNRISNLREVSKSENQQNRPLNSNNKSGFMGVSWNKKNRCWQAHIRTNGKSRNLGSYKTPAEAGAAYLAAKRLQSPFVEASNVL